MPGFPDLFAGFRRFLTSGTPKTILYIFFRHKYIIFFMYKIIGFFPVFSGAIAHVNLRQSWLIALLCQGHQIRLTYLSHRSHKHKLMLFRLFFDYFFKKLPKMMQASLNKLVADKFAVRY
jgi:hypothetical protein